MTIGAARIGAGIATEATMSDASSHQTPEMNTAPRSKVRVWEPLVRVFHWGLVAAFATAWRTADEL